MRHAYRIGRHVWLACVLALGLAAPAQAQTTVKHVYLLSSSTGDTVTRANSGYAVPNYVYPYLYTAGDWDPAPTVYFEAVLSQAGGGTAYAELYNATDSTTVTSSEVTTTSGSATRVRSAALTLTTAKRYTVRIKSSVTTTITTTMYSARLIFVQAGTVVKTETVYDMAGALNSSATTYTEDTSRPRYYHDDAFLDGTLAVYFEGFISPSNSAQTAYAQLHDGTSAVSGSEISLTGTTTDTMVRSSAITLTDNTNYQVQARASANNVRLRGARIILLQTASPTLTMAFWPLKPHFLGATSTPVLRVSQVLYDADEWTATYDVYHEAWMATSGGDTMSTELYDGATADDTRTRSGTTARSVSGALTLTDGDVFDARIYNSDASTQSAYGSFLRFHVTLTSNSPPTIALTSPADAGTVTTTTPTFVFTCADADTDPCRFHIQITDNPDDFVGGDVLVDSVANSGGTQYTIHTNPVAGTTWETYNQVDDRPGQAYQSRGGLLSRFQFYAGAFETTPTKTNGSYLVSVYDIDAGVRGTTDLTDWAASTAYSLGAKVKNPSVNNPDQQFVYVVTTAGTSRSVKVITGASWSSNISTFTSTGHGLAAGDTIFVTGVTPNGYDGLYTIIDAPTADTFTVAETSNPGTYTSGGSGYPGFSEVEDQTISDGTVTWTAHRGAGPASPAAAADTPTPGWLARSDVTAYNPGVVDVGWKDNDFTSTNRIRGVPGAWYVGIVDWRPADTDADNGITVRMRYNAATHNGNGYIDGASTVNLGPRIGDEMPFEVYEAFVLLDKTSGTDSGFANQADGGDTDPFTAGDATAFTVQGGDALADGVTYYWRVRTKDPTGSDTWSSWSATRSVTVTLSDTATGARMLMMGIGRPQE